MQKLLNDSHVSVIDTDTPNTVDTETEEFASASVLDICRAIINTLLGKPDMNENEELKREMNSVLQKLL